MTDEGAADLPLDSLMRLTNELLDTWESPADRTLSLTAARGQKDEGRLVVVFALSAHTHRLAAAALHLMVDEGAVLMRHAISTLNLIRDMRKAGLLTGLRDEVFEAPVVVTQTYWEYPAQGHVGDAGTALPDDLSDLGPGWQSWPPA